MRHWLGDIIITAFFGAIFGCMIGVLSYALSLLMPWLSDSQRAAIIPVSTIIGFFGGMCMVFMRGDVSPENDDTSKLEEDTAFGGPGRKEWTHEAIERTKNGVRNDFAA